MRAKVKTIQSIAIFLAIIVALLSTFSSAVFAEDSFIDEYGNYVEWWNFRNTETNNAVTPRPTPTNDKEAWGKWAARYGTSWAASPTPPIIVNNCLYIGMNNQVIKIDKETGQELQRSEEMPGNVGYAMNPPIYADGKIFVAITNSRIAAINISDMSLAWTTDNSDIIKGQTLSPISYVKIDGTGYIYTGTWSPEGGDLICTTTDNSDVIIDAEGNKIKALTWTFNPQIVDAENLEATDCVALGYYWTGAYVTENYLAVGADNGSTLGDYVNDTPFYTLDPLTGDIIDAVYGIKGMVRSTAVFNEGYLYFSTKDGKIYKIPVDEEGYLGEPSFIDMGEYDVASATATPVVYNGRIYLGVQGNGNQFSADGGHGFVVARDDEVLSQDSFVYKIPVPGYSQAGALLSDYHVDEDFDGDGEPDERVYLFFTYNTPLGGIFYTYDTPDQTEPTNLSVEESKIFIPASSQQQYCISPIVVDEDGNLYYKNDSGYVFAVESNPAALLDLKVFNEEGEQVSLDKEFHAKTAEYKTTVASEATFVSILLTLEEDVTATVNGIDYLGENLQIDLPDDVNDIEIVTNKNGKSRIYELTVTKASVNCDLSALGSAIRNTIPSATNQNTRPMEPSLSSDITDYTFDWITTGTGSTSTPVDPAKINQMNLFLNTESDNATVKVYAGENIDPEKVEPDGTILPASGSTNKPFKYRFPVYSADIKKDSTATIVVTAEDGVTSKEYHITFTRRVYVSEIRLNVEEAELNTGETLSLIANVFPENATCKDLTWSSTDKAVATVDNNGIVTAVEPGTTAITAESEDGPFAECVITVSDAPVFDKHRLLLSDEIGVGFRVVFPEGYDPGDCFVEFIASDGKNAIVQYEDADQADIDMPNARCFTFRVNALELAETITAILHNGDEIINVDEYSVMEYIETINNGSYAQKLKDLVNALHAYGYYMQSTDWTDKYAPHAPIDLPDQQLTADDIAEAKGAVSSMNDFVDDVDPAVIADYKVRLSLNAKTVIDVAVKPEAGVTVTSTDCTTVKIGNETYYMFKTDAIGPKGLGTNKEVPVETSGGNATVNCSAMSYVNRMFNNPLTSEEEEYALTAYYKYFAAARDYN